VHLHHPALKIVSEGQHYYVSLHDQCQKSAPAGRTRAQPYGKLKHLACLKSASIYINRRKPICSAPVTLSQGPGNAFDWAAFPIAIVAMTGIHWW
jgi:hypothetical protein